MPLANPSPEFWNIPGQKYPGRTIKAILAFHVAKAIYGLMQNEKLQDKTGSHNAQATNIGQAYAFGAGQYEVDEKAKAEIDEINKKVYARNDERINAIYDWGFEATMEAFEDLYKIIGTKFDFYFLESEMADLGREIVEANKGKVFEESDGAIVFQGGKIRSEITYSSFYHFPRLADVRDQRAWTD